MVKIGFIVEGPSDAKIIRSRGFNELLTKFNLQLVDIIIPEGKNHFFHPKADFTIIEVKVDSYIRILKDKGAGYVFFLVDQDTEPCFTSVKSKIPFSNEHTVIVCKRMLEAWYLADTQAMSAFLKSKFYSEYPENIPNPFEEIKALSLQNRNRGISNKIILANNMLKESFTIERAALHPNCDSAKYLIQRLEAIRI